MDLYVTVCRFVGWAVVTATLVYCAAPPMLIVTY